MPSSTDQTSIVNSALSKIGAKLILSINDNVKTAKYAKTRFTPCLEAVLREHPWNFAVERVISSPLADGPSFGYEYFHALPSDCLRILSINPEDDIEFRIEGRKIATDSDNLQIKYIKLVEDLTTCDALFVEALACYLAWDLSYPIVESNTLKEMMLKDYKMTLKRARNVDAQEEPAAELEAELFIDSRRSFTRLPMRGDR